MRSSFALFFLLSALVGCGGGNKGTAAGKGGLPPISNKPQGKVAKGAFSAFAGMVEVHNLMAIALSDAEHPCVKKSETRWAWICRSDQKRLQQGRQGSIEAHIAAMGISVLGADAGLSNSLWRKKGRSIELADQNFALVITREHSDQKYRFQYAGTVKFRSETNKGKLNFTERTWSIQGFIAPTDSLWNQAELSDLVIDFEELIRDDKDRQVALTWNQMASASNVVLDRCGRPEGEFTLKDSTNTSAQVVSSWEQGMGSVPGGTRTRWKNCAEDMASYSPQYLW